MNCKSKSHQIVNGSVCEPKRAKGGRGSAKDPAPVACDGAANSSRTPGREGSSCSTAPRNKKISAALPEAEIVRRIGGRMSGTPGITDPGYRSTNDGRNRDLLCGFPIRHSHITLAPVKPLNFFLIVFLLLAMASSRAQPPPTRNPDVSNKALITKSTPTINADRFNNQSAETA